MKILYKDYVAEAESDRFNLYKKGKTQKGKDKLDTIGYGYTFEGLLRKIAHLEMGKKSDMTFAEYIADYKKIIKEVEEAL